MHVLPGNAVCLRKLIAALLMLLALLPPLQDFYTEHPAVAALTSVEVDAYCLTRQIGRKSASYPSPVRTFDEAGFPPAVAAALISAGFEEPSPIQSAVSSGGPSRQFRSVNMSHWLP